MTINKFQGKTEAEAVEKAKKEMGQDVVIMNVKQIKPKGLFASFKPMTFEVTAAVEEKERFSNPISALHAQQKLHESMNMVADEKINMPTMNAAFPNYMQKPAAEAPVMPKEQPVLVPSENKEERNHLEARLDSLQTLLEKKLPREEKKPVEEEPSTAPGEEFKFLKMVYGILLDNEIDEKYVNEIMAEAEKVNRRGSSVDLILSNIYQKMILKFGNPKPIELTAGIPKVVFFIGPTGVGKTTTIAKIASRFKVEQGKKVAFLTADTYRIAAAEQLRTYANILDMPLTVVYTPDEMNAALERLQDYDLILVDTAGFSHKNETQRVDTKRLIEELAGDFEKEVCLVLSATTKYKDLLDIADIYHEIADYKLIFSKLDETSTYGNLLNVKLYSGADISYVTTGQNVPDDMEIFPTQKIVKMLLGGK